MTLTHMFSIAGTLLFNYFEKSFTKMFIINASLLLLSIIYSLINLKVENSTFNFLDVDAF